jgi:putative resolvase
MLKASDLTKNYYRPGEVAEMLGVHTMSVIRYDNDGLIEFERTAKNRRLISRDALLKYLDSRGLVFMNETRSDVIYALVALPEQKQNGDLDAQIGAVMTRVAELNPVNLEIISEVGNSLDDRRVGIQKLLKRVVNREIGRIFIARKAILAGYGFNYLQKLCDVVGTEIVVVGN